MRYCKTNKLQAESPQLINAMQMHSITTQSMAQSCLPHAAPLAGCTCLGAGRASATGVRRKEGTGSVLVPKKTRGTENRRDAIIPAQCHAECRGLEIVKSRCNSPFLCSCHTTMERTLAAEPAGLPLARVRLAPCCRDPDSRSLLQLGYLRSLRLDSGWGVQLLVLERMVSIESTRANQYMRTQTQPLPLPTSTL
jgi:hypothetical protein